MIALIAVGIVRFEFVARDSRVLRVQHAAVIRDIEAVKKSVDTMRVALGNTDYTASARRLEQVEIIANRIESALVNMPPMHQQQQIILPEQKAEGRNETIRQMLAAKGWLKNEE